MCSDYNIEKLISRIQDFSTEHEVYVFGKIAESRYDMVHDDYIEFSCDPHPYHYQKKIPREINIPQGPAFDIYEDEVLYLHLLCSENDDDLEF